MSSTWKLGSLAASVLIAGLCGPARADSLVRPTVLPSQDRCVDPNGIPVYYARPHAFYRNPFSVAYRQAWLRYVLVRQADDRIGIETLPDRRRPMPSMSQPAILPLPASVEPQVTPAAVGPTAKGADVPLPQPRLSEKPLPLVVQRPVVESAASKKLRDAVRHDPVSSKLPAPAGAPETAAREPVRTRDLTFLRELRDRWALIREENGLALEEPKPSVADTTADLPPKPSVPALAPEPVLAERKAPTPVLVEQVAPIRDNLVLKVPSVVEPLVEEPVRHVVWTESGPVALNVTNAPRPNVVLVGGHRLITERSSRPVSERSTALSPERPVSTIPAVASNVPTVAPSPAKAESDAQIDFPFPTIDLETGTTNGDQATSDDELPPLPVFSTTDTP